MSVNINRLRNAWEKSVGKASGISFDIASLLTDDPEELMLILSSSDEGMMVLDRVKKQYEKAQKLVKFANQFKEIKKGTGALFGDKLLAATNPHWNRFNARGTTEHFQKPITIPKARYNAVWDNSLRIANRLSTLVYPPITSEQAEQFRAEDETRELQRQYRIRSAGKRKPSLSGIGATDELANLNIINERLDRLDRIRSFGRATQASGFSRYARAEAQSNNDIDERNEYERERARNARLAESRGSIRNRKERLMLMREFPTFFRNSKMSTKDMRDMAKSLRAIQKIPIIGRIATNPIGAAGAILGAQKMAFNTSDAANKEVVDWQNLALMTGGLSKEFENAGYLAGMKSPGEIMGSLGKFQQMYGPAAEDMLRVYGSVLAAAPAETRQMLASSFNLNTKEAALAMALSNPELFASDQRITQAARNKISAMETMGYSTGSSLSDTIGSMWLSVMGGAQARDVSGKTDWSKKMRKSMEGDYADMMDRLVYTWDEVHDTAEIDNRYRAGMYDNSVTNNNGGERTVTVIQNVNAHVENKDAIGFMREMANLGGRSISECQSVIENTDTKRTK